MQLFDGGGVLVERMHNIVTYTVNHMRSRFARAKRFSELSGYRGFSFLNAEVWNIVLFEYFMYMCNGVIRVWVLRNNICEHVQA